MAQANVCYAKLARFNDSFLFTNSLRIMILGGLVKIVVTGMSCIWKDAFFIDSLAKSKR